MNEHSIHDNGANFLPCRPCPLQSLFLSSLLMIRLSVFCGLSSVEIQLRECFRKSHFFFFLAPLRAEEPALNFFQLTNLRRLEISQDPKTSSSRHTGSFRLI